MPGEHDPRECSESFLSGALDPPEVDEERRHLLRGPYREVAVERVQSASRLRGF